MQKCLHANRLKLRNILPPPWFGGWAVESSCYLFAGEPFPKLARGQRRVDDLKKALRAERDQANRVRRALFAPYRAPAMLLQGELDDDRKRVTHRPVDLREVAWWIATDLSCGPLGGAISRRATRPRLHTGPRSRRRLGGRRGHQRQRGGAQATVPLP